MATKDSGFDDDVKNVKSNLYMQKDDDRVSSKVRGLGPGMAAKRLEGRGVDIKGLTGNRANPDDLGSYKKGGKVKKMNMGGMANGGSASKRADGIAIKGKTKGKMLKKSGMAR